MIPGRGPGKSYKGEKMNLYFTPHTKISLIWNKELNVKSKTTNLLKKRERKKYLRGLRARVL